MTEQNEKKYKIVDDINFTKNKLLMIILNVSSAILIALLLVPLLLKLNEAIENSVVIKFEIKHLLYSFVLFFILQLVHEVIHGIFFKLISKSKITLGFTILHIYTHCDNYFFSKKDFKIITIAPTVIVNILVIVGLFLVDGPYLYTIYIAGALHFGGCVGDLYSFYKISKMKDVIAVKDTKHGLEFYNKKEYIENNSLEDVFSVKSVSKQN